MKTASRGLAECFGLSVGGVQRPPNFPSFYLLLDKEKKSTSRLRLRPGEANMILSYFMWLFTIVPFQVYHGGKKSFIV